MLASDHNAFVGSLVWYATSSKSKLFIQHTGTEYFTLCSEKVWFNWNSSLVYLITAVSTQTKQLMTKYYLNILSSILLTLSVQH